MILLLIAIICLRCYTQRYRDEFSNNPDSDFKREISNQESRLNVFKFMLMISIFLLIGSIACIVYNVDFIPISVLCLALSLSDVILYSILCCKSLDWKKTLEKERELVKSKKAGESESDEPQLYDDEWDYKCDYCGSLFSKESYTCPFCGAKRK